MRTKREYVYRLMLEQLSDVEKLEVTQIMCQEVLGATVDGALPLNADSEPLLQDVLAILASKVRDLRPRRSAA
jgi:hypothetical protein